MENKTKPEDSQKTLIFPPLYLLVFLILIVYLELYFPVWPIAYYPIKLIGAFISLFGLFALVDSNMRFKEVDTRLRPFEKSTCIVTSGLFGFSRNPIYLAMLLMLLGVELQLGIGFGMILVLAFFVIIQKRFIEREEVMMEEIFGQMYLKYKARVRRWL